MERSIHVRMAIVNISSVTIEHAWWYTFDK